MAEDQDGDEDGSEVSRTDPPPGGEPVVPAENAVVEALLGSDWTIAVAESLTGGQISARLCACPGVEERVLGGVVSYSTDAKRAVLGVRAEQVVSSGAAAEMAGSVRRLFGADVGLGLTGVAGPARQEGEPVGKVYVAWNTPVGAGARQLACAGSPEQIRRMAADRALEILRDELEGPTAVTSAR